MRNEEEIRAELAQTQLGLQLHALKPEELHQLRGTQQALLWVLELDNAFSPAASALANRTTTPDVPRSEP